ncbi:hypothetical protein S40285_04180 [Stachybotrys chlorohalonatus IBT 40285]|uniref:INO80 complex subunit B-like conserved region domain-containing protein n=1 Tax=Stachybotrys chlorohalonatus (strain IBT 40285) TaxID=1283841 RepID=A0A084QCR0_STAC4|nr:hypothetical protein S40285_04180 [Stachybotrys chlorohalonata IBT 40285]
MASRPRRSAATKANEVISVHAKWANTSEKSERSERSAMSSRRSGRNSGGATLRDAPSSQDDLSVEVASSKPRQSGRGAGRRDPFEGGEIVHGKRNRGAKKSYVVDSSPDDEEEEEEEEAEIDDDGVDEDAEGEDDMELDAEGEDVDADGDVSMNMTPNIIRPTIKVSRPAALPRARPVVEDDDEDDDDEELSDPGESEPGDETMAFGDDTVADADEDAEGEEIEVAGDEEDEDEDEEDEEAEGAEGAGEDDSDEEGSQGEAPDLNKMTKRQRARFEDEPQQYMKLSDEVQVKKHFTAEELSMRRQEMARRRRNLSEKRNEEVKMETINKLLKKQAPKVSRKAAAANEAGDEDAQRANPVFVRWVSNRNGVRVGVPGEVLDGPAGAVFGGGGGARGLASGKMVEEVA